MPGFGDFRAPRPDGFEAGFDAGGDETDHDGEHDQAEEHEERVDVPQVGIRGRVRVRAAGHHHVRGEIHAVPPRVEAEHLDVGHPRGEQMPPIPAAAITTVVFTMSKMKMFGFAAMRFSSPYVMRSSTVTGPSVFAGEPAAVRADSAAAASRPWNLDARVESGATLAESAPPRPMVSEGNGSRTALEQACAAVTRRRRDQRTPAPRGRRAAPSVETASSESRERAFGVFGVCALFLFRGVVCRAKLYRV